MVIVTHVCIQNKQMKLCFKSTKNMILQFHNIIEIVFENTILQAMCN